jgi:hypothetical protein
LYGDAEFLPGEKRGLRQRSGQGVTACVDAVDHFAAPPQELHQAEVLVVYWAREIFGVYSRKDRFVYVSDGATCLRLPISRPAFP